MAIKSGFILFEYVLSLALGLMLVTSVGSFIVFYRQRCTFFHNQCVRQTSALAAIMHIRSVFRACCALIGEGTLLTGKIDKKIITLALREQRLVMHERVSGSKTVQQHTVTLLVPVTHYTVHREGLGVIIAFVYYGKPYRFFVAGRLPCIRS